MSKSIDEMIKDLIKKNYRFEPGYYDVLAAKELLMKNDSYSEDGFIKLTDNDYYEFAGIICRRSDYIISKSEKSSFYSALYAHIIEKRLDINEKEFEQIVFIFNSFRFIRAKDISLFLNEETYSIDLISEIFALSDKNRAILKDEACKVLEVVSVDSSKSRLSVLQYAKILSKLDYLSDAKIRFNLLKPLTM
ncbi:hypothetical protein [Fluviispira sanaruensis]|uniref:Uncharacterized protein n=1 Tax=Fluviispira sanaruensis TaxID=2493639 RepID=A0A4P2VMS8_FLUSA|nr:hypothetical protein [Fluviispira sanaruensis]BBH54726.1 hypothetical protein JCM31447_32000 [Fluviispira sanaruensis]